MKKTIIFFIFFLTLVVLVGCNSKENGGLKGKVSIGPITPVVQEGVPDPTPDPTVLAARKIIIYTHDGNKEIARIPIQPDGSYSVTLPTGMYLVDINHLGIDYSKDLPVVVEIKQDQISELNIFIDTGIR